MNRKTKLAKKKKKMEKQKKRKISENKTSPETNVFKSTYSRK